jgi:hypothetical protein
MKEFSANFTAAKSREGLRSLITLRFYLPILLAAVLWSLSLPAVDPNRMGDLGLVSVLPPLFFYALIVLAIGFSWNLFDRTTPQIVLLGYVILLILMIHGTPQIVYGTLRYSWAWKHVGIVDYIQRHGSVDPNIEYLTAYHNWPGFFALSALVAEVMGAKSLVDYAGWAPFVFNLLDMGALVLIFRTLTRDQRLVWLGVWFFYLANWVGQDYFSPQAFTYFLYLGMIFICLRWFKGTPRFSFPFQQKDRKWYFYKARDYLTEALDRHEKQSGKNQHSRSLAPLNLRAALSILLLLISFSLVTSHQLTPLIAISALALLGLSHCIRPTNLPIFILVLLITWVIFMTLGFLKGNIYWIVSSIGHLTANIHSSFVDLSQSSPGQVLVANADRALSAMIWGLALLGGIRRLQRRYWDLAAILLIIAPFPLFAANSYGGEILFRVYYFALPWVSFFAAATLFPGASAGRSERIPVIQAALSIVLLAGLLLAYYGKDRMYYFTKVEVAAAEYINSHAPPGSLVMDGLWNWPLQYKNYEFYQYLSIAGLEKQDILAVIHDPVDQVAAIMKKYPSAFFIITRSQKVGSDMNGTMPPGSLEKVEYAIRHSNRFTILFDHPDAVIFQLAPVSEGIKR